MKKKTIGILGVGQLSEFIIEGINNNKANYDFVLSPRSQNRASKISAKFNYKIAQSNQEVLDNCQMILICLPSNESDEILCELNFEKTHSIMSPMAGVSIEKLQKVTKISNIYVAMMPGYANVNGNGPIAMHPFNKNWNEFLSFLGPVLILETKKQFDIAATFGALSGVSFVFLQTLIDWFVEKGLDYDVAKILVLQTFSGNIDVIKNQNKDLNSIINAVSTTGGITEKLVLELDSKDALEAWTTGLEKILTSIGK
jgi:pyrroline-5-carboxylate reductase